MLIRWLELAYIQNVDQIARISIQTVDQGCLILHMHKVLIRLIRTVVMSEHIYKVLIRVVTLPLAHSIDLDGQFAIILINVPTSWQTLVVFELLGRGFCLWRYKVSSSHHLFSQSGLLLARCGCDFMSC
jgi:hypothetical protein